MNTKPRTRFSEILRGAKAALPISLSVMTYGSVLGVPAAQKGITWYQMLLMDLSIFAGTAQFVMVDMWLHPLPLAAMTTAVLIINLRYLLIGASMEPLFRGKSLPYKLGVIHLTADENWALTMSEVHKSNAGTSFHLGGGICLIVAWTAGTLLGLMAGSAVADPEAYALDFAFAAVFTALAVGLRQGRQDLLPWLVAGLLAFFGEKYLPGKWYVFIGGLGGAITAMLGPIHPAPPAPGSPGDTGGPDGRDGSTSPDESSDPQSPGESDGSQSSGDSADSQSTGDLTGPRSLHEPHTPDGSTPSGDPAGRRFAGDSECLQSLGNSDGRNTSGPAVPTTSVAPAAPAVPTYSSIPPIRSQAKATPCALGRQDARPQTTGGDRQ